MSQYNLSPDIVSYSYILQSMNGYDSKTILNFWNEFKQVYEPNLGSYYSVIKALSGGNINEIKDIYKEMLTKRMVWI